MVHVNNGICGDCSCFDDGWLWLLWVVVPDMVSFRLFGRLHPVLATFRLFGAPTLGPSEKFFSAFFNPCPEFAVTLQRS